MSQRNGREIEPIKNAGGVAIADRHIYVSSLSPIAVPNAPGTTEQPRGRGGGRGGGGRRLLLAAGGSQQGAQTLGHGMLMT